MSLKRFLIPEYGEITLYRRRGVRSIKLSVSHSGEVKVTMPTWTPYKVGLAFINSNKVWIDQQRVNKIETLASGDRIGKAHQLVYVPGETLEAPRARLVANEIRIFLPRNEDWQADNIQLLAKKYANKALRSEAEQLLPRRLAKLAKKYGFKYRNVKIKQLKSRWGSCNSFGDITLNYFLMQLPWELIDYVILHELTHTKVMAHGSKFWNELIKTVPNVKQLRKDILIHKPTVLAINQ